MFVSNFDPVQNFNFHSNMRVCRRDLGGGESVEPPTPSPAIPTLG